MPRKELGRVPPFASSNVEQIWYVFASRTLYVEYKETGLYAYSDVPARLYHALRRVKSKGTFINKYLVGRYEHRHLGD